MQGELAFFLTLEVLPELHVVAIIAANSHNSFGILDAAMPARLDGMRASANGAGGALKRPKAAMARYASRPTSLAMRSE